MYIVMHFIQCFYTGAYAKCNAVEPKKDSPETLDIPLTLHNGILMRPKFFGHSANNITSNGGQPLYREEHGWP